MSYFRNPSSSNTYQKCQKILRMFSQTDQQPTIKQAQTRPSSSSKQNPPPYYLSKSTAKKSSSKALLGKSTSASKYGLKSNTNLTSQYQSSTANKIHQESSLFREKSNSSFVSCYKKESRLEQIMRLKVQKPKLNASVLGLRTNKKAALLNSSFSSLNSSRSSLNKENMSRNCNKESRLEKIMNIKVQKPKVNSTLLGYEPRKAQRSASKSMSKKNSFLAENNSVIQLKQCKKKIRKSEQIDEKQDRLWRLFERQRQQQVQEQKKREDMNYKEQRRNQQKFQKLVQKQLKKIQNTRQISLRKEKVFSPYVYPAY